MHVDRAKKLTALKALWNKTCKHDEVEPTASFIVFSTDNPYVAIYNKAVGEFYKEDTHEITM